MSKKESDFSLGTLDAEVTGIHLKVEL